MKNEGMPIDEKLLFSLSDFLKNETEGDIQSTLSTFKCSLDPDFEDFLMRYAIPFEKAHKSRTYLILNPNSIKGPELEIYAYFSVAMDHLQIRGNVSRSMKRRLNGIFEVDRVPCFLIGQVAKNDKFIDMVDGEEIIHYAMAVLHDAHQLIGGRFSRVDCKDEEKVLDFYRANDFTLLPDKDENGFCQLVRFLHP